MSTFSEEVNNLWQNEEGYSLGVLTRTVKDKTALQSDIRARGKNLSSSTVSTHTFNGTLETSSTRFEPDSSRTASIPLVVILGGSLPLNFTPKTGDQVQINGKTMTLGELKEVNSSRSSYCFIANNFGEAIIPTPSGQSQFFDNTFDSRFFA